jgi:hypothetical protein
MLESVPYHTYDPKSVSDEKNSKRRKLYTLSTVEDMENVKPQIAYAYENIK